MSETISPTFTFVKDGVFYFSRRIPKELLRHYSSPRIAYSLRTRSAKVADARARKAADQLDDYWFHLRSQDAEMPGKHMLRMGTAAIDGSAPMPPHVYAATVARPSPSGPTRRPVQQVAAKPFHNESAGRRCL